MNERTKRLSKPKAKTQFITGPVSGHGGNVLAPGTLGKSGDFSSFTVSISSTARLVFLIVAGTQGALTGQISGIQGCPYTSERSIGSDL